MKSVQTARCMLRSHTPLPDRWSGAISEAAEIRAALRWIGGRNKFERAYLRRHGQRHGNKARGG